MKVPKGFRATIGDEVGTYYGEVQGQRKKAVVCGRGALNCEDKCILGYSENG